MTRRRELAIMLSRSHPFLALLEKFSKYFPLHSTPLKQKSNDLKLKFHSIFVQFVTSRTLIITSIKCIMNKLGLSCAKLRAQLSSELH